MGRNVCVYPTNWRWTGQDVPTPQAQVDLEIHWIDNGGVPQQWNGVLTFPDDLQLVPVSWVKAALHELLLRAVRVRLGIDEVEP